MTIPGVVRGSWEDVSLGYLPALARNPYRLLWLTVLSIEEERLADILSDLV